jgi:predicted nuclease with TOPRIM domain
MNEEASGGQTSEEAMSESRDEVTALREALSDMEERERAMITEGEEWKASMLSVADDKTRQLQQEREELRMHRDAQQTQVATLTARVSELVGELEHHDAERERDLAGKDAEVTELRARLQEWEAQKYARDSGEYGDSDGAHEAKDQHIAVLIGRVEEYVVERARMRVELMQLNGTNRQNQELTREIAAVTEQRNVDKERQIAELQRKEAALTTAHKQRETLEKERREQQQHILDQESDDSGEPEWRATVLELAQTREMVAERESVAALLRLRLEEADEKERCDREEREDVVARLAAEVANAREQGAAERAASDAAREVERENARVVQYALESRTRELQAAEMKLAAFGRAKEEAEQTFAEDVELRKQAAVDRERDQENADRRRLKKIQDLTARLEEIQADKATLAKQLAAAMNANRSNQGHSSVWHARHEELEERATELRARVAEGTSSLAISETKREALNTRMCAVAEEAAAVNAQLYFLKKEVEVREAEIMSREAENAVEVVARRAEAQQREADTEESAVKSAGQLAAWEGEVADLQRQLAEAMTHFLEQREVGERHEAKAMALGRQLDEKDRKEKNVVLERESAAQETAFVLDVQARELDQLREQVKAAVETNAEMEQAKSKDIAALEHELRQVRAEHEMAKSASRRLESEVEELKLVVVEAEEASAGVEKKLAAMEHEWMREREASTSEQDAAKVWKARYEDKVKHVAELSELKLAAESARKGAEDKTEVLQNRVYDLTAQVASSSAVATLSAGGAQRNVEVGADALSSSSSSSSSFSSSDASLLGARIAELESALRMATANLGSSTGSRQSDTSVTSSELRRMLASEFGLDPMSFDQPSRAKRSAPNSAKRSQRGGRHALDLSCTDLVGDEEEDEEEMCWPEDPLASPLRRSGGSRAHAGMIVGGMSAQRSPFASNTPPNLDSVSELAQHRSPADTGTPVHAAAPTARRRDLSISFGVTADVKGKAVLPASAEAAVEGEEELESVPIAQQTQLARLEELLAQLQRRGAELEATLTRAPEEVEEENKPVVATMVTPPMHAIDDDEEEPEMQAPLLRRERQPELPWGTLAALAVRIEGVLTHQAEVLERVERARAREQSLAQSARLENAGKSRQSGVGAEEGPAVRRRVLGELRAQLTSAQEELGSNAQWRDRCQVAELQLSDRQEQLSRLHRERGELRDTVTQRDDDHHHMRAELASLREALESAKAQAETEAFSSEVGSMWDQLAEGVAQERSQVNAPRVLSLTIQLYRMPCGLYHISPHLTL